MKPRSQPLWNDRPRSAAAEFRDYSLTGPGDPGAYGSRPGTLPAVTGLRLTPARSLDGTEWNLGSWLLLDVDINVNASYMSWGFA